MRRHFDDSLQAFVYRCPHCGYQRIEVFDFSKLSQEDREYVLRHTGDKPFIKGTTEFIYEEEHDYAPNTIEKTTVYACPNCGILQISL